MLKISVMVSGGGTNFQAVIDGVKSGEIPDAEIVQVISSSEKAFALERAAKNGIPAYVMSHKEPEKIIERLNAEGTDLIVLAGYMKVLDSSIIQAYRGRIINIHPSLIPSFCGKGYYGLKVHEAALAYGVKVTGATVHFVNEIPDGGKIIMQKAVEIREDDTAETLQRRVMEEAEWKLLPKAVEMVSKELLEEKENERL